VILLTNTTARQAAAAAAAQAAVAGTTAAAAAVAAAGNPLLRAFITPRQRLCTALPFRHFVTLHRTTLSRTAACIGSVVDRRCSGPAVCSDAAVSTILYSNTTVRTTP
jgi:hypothetical protein